MGLLILGLVISIYTETFFRHLIQNLFRWSTHNHINFYGKNFFLFNKPVYYISFSISALLFGTSNKTKPFSKIMINAIVLFLIFRSVLTLISAIDATAKIAECTACDDGTRSIHYNDINYSVILSISLLTAVVPDIFKIIRNRKANTNRS